MKYKLLSLGCKVNSYECTAIGNELAHHGFEETFNDDPDVIIINTCSVTSTADQKSRQHIRKMMRSYPQAIVVVMGCYAQGNKEYIANEINPHILIGTSNRHRVYELIEKYKQTQTPIVAVDDNPRMYCYEELGINAFSENARAYLKIQDGCDNFCSYCLIPYRRGKCRSRNKEDILNEAKALVSKGYPEIVLTGIHVGGYGKDLDGSSFSELVESLLDVEGLKSLRISSIEESEIDERLIHLLATRSNLAKHLHIPLQSGSESVLKRMNRKYTKEEFLTKIKKIKLLLPDVALTSDVIVGFPGESEEEFLECQEFIKECGFNMLHVFPFSPREGTAAILMKNQISPNIKNQRAKTLIELSNKLWNKYLNQFVGKKATVLIERYDAKEKMNIGHTSNYIEVKIPGNNDLSYQFIDVLLEKNMIISD